MLLQFDQHWLVFDGDGVMGASLDEDRGGDNEENGVPSLVELNSIGINMDFG